MNQERQSGNDSEAGTGVLEPPTAATAPPGLARVKALKARIHAGTYHVPADQIADALFDYMRVWRD